MSSEGTLAVSAAVVALVQVLKWAGLRDSWGPIAVIVGSLFGVAIWLVSGASWPPARTDIWPIFTGCINVALTSAGAFGFTRAAAAAVTSMRPPPADGAGSSPTVKPDEAAETEEARAEIRARAQAIREQFPDALDKEARP